VGCVVPLHVVQRLGLATMGQRMAEYADGRQEPMAMTEAFMLEILGREEIETALVLRDDQPISKIR